MYSSTNLGKYCELLLLSKMSRKYNCANLLFIVFCCFKYISCDTDCRININEHLKKNSRLILYPYSSSTDGYRFYLPQSGQNFLSFKKGQEVVFACPNGLYEHAHCQTGEKFNFSNPVRELAVGNITCRRPLRSSVRILGKCYNNEINHIAVGISIRQDQSISDFIKLIDICFNSRLKTSIYAKFTIMQGVESRQKNVKRSNFTCTQVYGLSTEQYDDIFRIHVQYNRLLSILGSRNTTDKYISHKLKNDLYLAKTNLVAFKDFVYYSQQQITSLCANTVPMWQIIRKGNWRNLEESVRKYASKEAKDLTVYTGTYGVLELRNESGSDIPIYLAKDNGDIDILPVSKLVWKLVYDRLLRQGIVFLVINNHDSEINATEYEICDDVCNETSSWFIGWDRFQINFGYIYCCTVHDFFQINSIPEFRDVVLGLLS